MVSPWLIAEAMLAPSFALLYDHLLTFNMEIQYIWFKPKRRSAYLFLLLRYFASFGEIATLVFRFYEAESTAKCNSLQTYVDIYTLLIELLVAYLMSMRVYALYGCSPRIKWLLLAVVACILPIIGWSVVESSIGTVLLQGMLCGRFFPEKKASYLTVTWACALAYDTIIFALTLFKTYLTMRHADVQFAPVRMPLLELMLRDGAIYFGVMCCVHLANLVLCATRSSSMSALARAASTTMVARLMLNLHEKASEGILLTQDMSLSLSTIRSSLVFNDNAECIDTNATFDLEELRS